MEWLLTVLVVLALWTLFGFLVALLMAQWLKGKGISQWD